MTVYSNNTGFRVQDHPTTASGETDDNLLRIEFLDGLFDLPWESLEILLMDVEEGVIYTCYPYKLGQESNCTVVEETPDNTWDVGEVISISERGVDVCRAPADESGCDLNVRISYDGVILRDFSEGAITTN